ncbi:Hypp5459 [Branchiostoma lanceolatum]|uniref:Hypp5459 protein n=1 Tax=Branchiostoma lanceolatum TaxID=7740 RepID=A0A8J9YKZ6_BRALA|nr:Hypp5459 [Branchiostoma lanceolatum]
MASGHGTSPRSRKGRPRRQEYPSSATLGSFWDHHPAVNLQSVEDILDRKLREGQGHDVDDPVPRSSPDQRYEVSPDQLGSFVGHRSERKFRSVDDVTTQGVTSGQASEEGEDTPRPKIWTSQERSQDTASYSTLGSRPSPVDLKSVENIISNRYGGKEDAPRSNARLPEPQDRSKVSQSYSTLGSGPSPIGPQSVDSVLNYKYEGKVYAPKSSTWLPVPQEWSQESQSYSTLGSRPSPVDLQSVENVLNHRYGGKEDSSRSAAWLPVSQDRGQDSPSYSTLGSRPSPVDLQSVENVLSHRYGVTIPHSDLPSRSSSRTSVSREEPEVTPSSSTLGSTSRRRSIINLRSIEDVIRRKFRSFRHHRSSSGEVDGSNMAPFIQASSIQTLPMSLHPSDVTFGSSTEAGLSDFNIDTNVWNVDSDMAGGIRASSRQPRPRSYSTMPPGGYFATNRPAVHASQSSHAGSSYAASTASSDVSMATSVPMETPSATSLKDLLGWEDDISDQDSDSDSDSEPQLDDPAQYKYCYRCDGIGITHSDDTWHWAPSRELPCHFCRRCVTCRGNGVIPINANICHRCEGKGFLHGTPAAHTQTGRVRCLLCEDCGACEGKGVMPAGRALCAQCRGRGAVHAGGWAEVPHRARRTQRCFFCTPCDWCNGKGTIQTGYTL